MYPSFPVVNSSIRYTDRIRIRPHEKFIASKRPFQFGFNGVLPSPAVMFLLPSFEFMGTGSKLRDLMLKRMLMMEKNPNAAN